MGFSKMILATLLAASVSHGADKTKSAPAPAPAAKAEPTPAPAPAPSSELVPPPTSAAPMNIGSLPKGTEDDDAAVCATDISQFCADVPKGDGRVEQCLRDRLKKLSAECGKRIRDRKEQSQEMRTRCAADIKSLCAKMPGGKNAVMRCLHLNTKSLSGACREKMEEVKERKKNNKGRRTVDD